LNFRLAIALEGSSKNPWPLILKGQGKRGGTLKKDSLQ